MTGSCLQFSGVLRNCLCRGGLSGYIDFENAEFYRAHFNVMKWWRGAAVIGALPVFGSFLAAILLLIRLKSLWHASEQSNPLGGDVAVEMQWLI
jgi:hypothetical protein